MSHGGHVTVDASMDTTWFIWLTRMTPYMEWHATWWTRHCRCKYGYYRVYLVNRVTSYVECSAMYYDARKCVGLFDSE